jgi:hypothetical protein
MAVETDIHRGILLAIGNRSNIPVAWPNVEYGGQKPYAKVDIIPGNTLAWSMTTTNLYQGIIQIGIVTGSGQGEIKSMLLAENFISMFPRNSILDFNGTRIRFNGPASIRKPMNEQVVEQPEEGQYMVYISVPFIVLQ